MHSFQLSSMDALALLHNDAAAIGARIERSLALSHEIIFERISRQEALFMRQREAIDSLFEKIQDISNRLPASPPPPPPPPLTPDPAINDIQAEIQNLKKCVEDGFKRSALSTLAILEDVQNTNERLGMIEEQLTELRAKNVRFQDKTPLPNTLQLQSVASPATMIARNWQNITHPPGNSFCFAIFSKLCSSQVRPHADFQDDMSSAMCINPLEVLKKTPSRSLPPTDSSVSDDSSSQVDRTSIDVPSKRSLLPKNGLQAQAVAVSSTTISVAPISAGSIRSSSPLSDISESEGEENPIYKPVVCRTTPILKKRKRRLPVTQGNRPVGRPRKQPRLDTAKGVLRSFAIPRSSAKKTSRRKVSNDLASIWPKQDGLNANSNKFIQCSSCESWFHWGCVGIGRNAVDAERAEFFCPPCVHRPSLGPPTLPTSPGRTNCARPGCMVADTGTEFIIECFVGRYRYGIGPDGSSKYSWLIKWEGYTIDECSWAPEHELDDPDQFIERFEREVKNEDATDCPSKPGLLLLQVASEAGWDTRIQ